MADAVMINGSDSLDLRSLLSSSKRDFVIRSNGDQLERKEARVIFLSTLVWPLPALHPGVSLRCTRKSLQKVTLRLFVSADEDEAAFNGYFSDMAWLAVPFSDSETRDRLDELFKVNGIPHLVILDDSGKVVTKDGVEIVQLYGVEGYPFTAERIKEIKDQEVEAKRNQSLKSILVSGTREFVVSSSGEKVNQVLVSELEGKTVGLYFSLSFFSACAAFVPSLVNVYEKLKANGENIAIVLVPLDEEEESFKQSFGSMPWLSLPFKDRSCEKLVLYFELSTLPTLVIIGPDGKTLQSNAADAIEEHGTLAYPFTPEKFAELAEIEKAIAESQTLESVLVSGDQDFVFGKGGAKIKVSDLVGKTILIYFSAHWCPPCRAFLPILIESYHKIKAKDDAFEVIFISSDRDQASFDEFFGERPWLTLPFGDNRKASLSRLFKVQGIPMLVALGPTGKTLTREARELIMLHGADAYPFSKERLEEIEAEYEDMAKGLPKKLKHSLHEEHELALSRRPVYTCDGCEESGQVWSFYCDQCDFDLHAKCALEEGKETKEAKEEVKEGFVCDGDVCRRV